MVGFVVLSQSILRFSVDWVAPCSCFVSCRSVVSRFWRLDPKSRVCYGRVSHAICVDRRLLMIGQSVGYWLVEWFGLTSQSVCDWCKLGRPLGKEVAIRINRPTVSQRVVAVIPIKIGMIRVWSTAWSSGFGMRLHDRTTARSKSNHDWNRVFLVQMITIGRWRLGYASS